MAGLVTRGEARLNQLLAQIAQTGVPDERAAAFYLKVLGQTKHFDQGQSMLSDLVASEALGGNTPFLASTATDWTLQRRIQAQIPGYQVVTAHCTLAILRDTNRAQLCNDVANRLLNDKSALISPILGFRLGERLAWPEQRLAAINEELNALRAVSGETTELLYGDAKLTADEDPIAQGRAGCEAMDRSTAFLNTQLRVGEVQELRDRLANHTLSRAALAAQYAATAAAAQYAREHPPAKR